MSLQKTVKDLNSITVFSAFLFIFIFFKTTGYAQDEVIRIDTNLVTVPATVLDREGRYITNLKKEAFQIFDNGVEQEIELFEPTEQPFTVFFLLDTSGSMVYHLIDLADAANAFTSQLRPDDQLIAATFADNVYILFQATKTRDLKKGIKLQQHKGDRYTRVYDAVELALKKMKKVTGRKAVVLFSDGDSADDLTSLKDSLINAEENEAIIYTVQFDTFPSTPPPYVSAKIFYQSVERANKYMKGLAEITGGRAYQIKTITDLKETFALVAAELGRQYRLGYYPKEQSKAGEKRQIKVKMRQPNLVVRARDSYIVQSSKNK